MLPTPEKLAAEVPSVLAAIVSAASNLGFTIDPSAIAAIAEAAVDAACMKAWKQAQAAGDAAAAKITTEAQAEAAMRSAK